MVCGETVAQLLPPAEGEIHVADVSLWLMTSGRNNKQRSKRCLNKKLTKAVLSMWPPVDVDGSCSEMIKKM